LTGYNPSLWIAGKIAVGNQDGFIDELQRLAVKLDIVENIFFLGWQDNFPAVIQAADICILPSHTEGLPRSILESMVLGKPVIATPVGGIGDAIKDSITGFFMPIDDDEVLANLVLQFVKNPLLKEQIITNASDFVMKHFNPELHTAGIEKILKKITK
jgi:glycosyltransferase involved in cell wall biosynthesis